MAGETIFVLGEGGTIFKLGLPLHETMEGKLAKGELRVLRDVEGDGTANSPYVEAGGDTPAPEPAVEPAAEVPAKAAAPAAKA